MIAMSAYAPAFLTFALLLAASPMLAGCNTTAGAGKDVSAAGAAMTESARKHAP
jgi:predicted small secreted protein